MSRDLDDDFDGADEADFDTDEDDVLAPCPFCGEEIYDDAERCPACGKYLSREDVPSDKKPLWIIVGAIVCLAIAILWAIFG